VKIPWLTKAHPEWPEPLRRYAEAFRYPSKRASLESTRFVVFDTETTGLDLAKNRLLALASVGLEQGDIVCGDRFEVWVRQDTVGAADAVRIHGLVRRDVAQGLDEDLAVAQFLEHADSAVLVAHHAAFDMAMLKKALAPHRGAKVKNPVVDTMTLALRLESGPVRTELSRSRIGLDALADSCGVGISGRHTAAGDALATARVFQVLLRRARKRGIRTLGQLLGG
jgi:DNA polymerase-3 subunit epsilon